MIVGAYAQTRMLDAIISCYSAYVVGSVVINVLQKVHKQLQGILKFIVDQGTKFEQGNKELCEKREVAYTSMQIILFYF